MTREIGPKIFMTQHRAKETFHDPSKSDRKHFVTRKTAKKIVTQHSSHKNFMTRKITLKFFITRKLPRNFS